MHQSTPFQGTKFENFFWEEGTSPPRHLPQWGGGTPSPHPTSSILVPLAFRALHWKIIDPPLSPWCTIIIHYTTIERRVSCYYYYYFFLNKIHTSRVHSVIRLASVVFLWDPLEINKRDNTRRVFDIHYDTDALTRVSCTCFTMRLCAVTELRSTKAFDFVVVWEDELPAGDPSPL